MTHSIDVKYVPVYGQVDYNEDQLVYDHNKLFNVNQSVFWKRRNMFDQLIKLDDISKYAAKCHVLWVFLDIEKAFDMVWRKGVLYKMDKLRFGGRIFNWVQGFLSGHTTQVCICPVMSDAVDGENDIVLNCNK